MKLFLMVLLSVVVLFSVSCGNNNQEAGDTARVSKTQPHTKTLAGITHIYNTAAPDKGVVTPGLEMLLEIDSSKINSDTAAFFNEAAKDSKNNLFLLDSKASRIYRFTLGGKFEKSFLQKGEGPGEIRKPVLTFKVSGSNVWASYVTEFCRFGTDGNFLEKKRFKQQYGLLEHVDEKRFITSYDTYKEGEKTGRICVLMDTEENLLAELFEKKDPNIGYSVIKLPNKNFEFVSGTSPRLGYIYSPIDNLIYCYYNFDYSIWVMSLDGKVQKVIHKEHKDVEIKDAEIKRILSGLKRMGWPQHYLDAYKKAPPEKNLPAIRKVCLFPNGYFGVIRSIDYDKEELDIFDPEGRFVYILKACKEIPYWWDVYFFKDSLGVIIHDDERDIYREYKVKNLPRIFSD